MTFRERYCEKHGIALEHFERVVLRRALYLRARLLQPFLFLVPRHFTEDLELVRMAGNAKDFATVHEIENDFREGRGQVGILRGFLKLRLSGRRLLGIAAETFGRK